MSLFALILILASSVLHVFWNLLAKKSSDKLSLLFWAITPLAGFSFVIIFSTSFDYSQINPFAWLYIVATCIVHAFYFYNLTSSYELADLSFVYPYSRALASLVVIAFGIIFLAERPSFLGCLGMSFLVSAIFIEAFSRKKQFVSKAAWNKVLLTGFFAACYLVIDKLGVSVFNPLHYLCFMFLGVNLLLSPWLLTSARIRNTLVKERRLVVGAALSMGSAYMGVLWAMTQSPISYVVSARAAGIAVSALFGYLLLQERPTRIRYIGVGLTILGTIFIGLA